MMGPMHRTTAAERAAGIIGGEYLAAARLVSLWYEAGEAERHYGETWYDEARRAVADLADSASYGRSFAAAVVAVLSPLCRWQHNLAAAASLLDGAPGWPVGPLRANVVKVRAMIDAYRAGGDWVRFVRGPKVQRFWRACDPTVPYAPEAVCDVWAQRAAAGRPVTDSEAKCLATGGYATVERAYLIAAQTLGRPCHVVQAVAWVVVRGGHE